MSEQPDLSTLPQRMRYAAEVLTEASSQMFNTAGEHWTPNMLLSWADHREAENSAAVEELAQEIHAARWPKHSDPTNGAYLPDYRKAARKLIEDGWRKGDPK